MYSMDMLTDSGVNRDGSRWQVYLKSFGIGLRGKLFALQSNRKRYRG